MINTYSFTWWYKTPPAWKWSITGFRQNNCHVYGYWIIHKTVRGDWIYIYIFIILWWAWLNISFKMSTYMIFVLLFFVFFLLFIHFCTCSSAWKKKKRDGEYFYACLSRRFSLCFEINKRDYFCLGWKTKKHSTTKKRPFRNNIY